MMIDSDYMQAAANVAGEPASVEADGTVWADSDGRQIEVSAVMAERDRIIAAREQTRHAAVAKLAALGLTVDDLTALGF